MGNARRKEPVSAVDALVEKLNQRIVDLEAELHRLKELYVASNSQSKEEAVDGQIS